MSFPLCCDALQHGCGNLLVGTTIAEEWSDIGFFQTEQAIAEFSVCGNAEPIAAAAERLAHAGDQANSAPAVGEFVVLSRGGGGLRQEWSGRDWSQRTKFCSQPFKDFMSEEDLISLPQTVGVQRHEFDESHDGISFPSESAEWDQLILGKPANGDCIELNR